jgi:hypothetical protein
MKWLRQTGQRWKVLVFFVTLVPGVVESMRWMSGPGDLKPLPIASGLLAFAWLFLSIKCPRCGARIAWRLATTAKATDWWTKLSDAENCAACTLQEADREKTKLFRNV